MIEVKTYREVNDGGISNEIEKLEYDESGRLEKKICDTVYTGDTYLHLAHYIVISTYVYQEDDFTEYFSWDTEYNNGK